jgi:hypothetical protein
MNKQNKETLLNAKHSYYTSKYTSYPIHLMPKSNYTDATANGLTKCIKDFLNYSGHQAERISSMGRVIDKKKKLTDIMGRTIEVGSSQYIPSTSTAGTADISAIIKGRAVKIEVKIGKDKQSQAQKQYEADVTAAGGVYVIARDFDGFMEWYLGYLNEI